MWFIFLNVVLLTITEIKGAADYDVEQIKSPYVDIKDTGTRMSMTSSNRHSSQHESGPYFNQRNLQHSCVACQYGTTGSSGSSYSSSYQAPGTYRTYSSPVKLSSQHEFKEKQKFVNGQQVYDFQQEKEYKDGNLVKNEIREKSPDDFGVNSHSQGATAYGSSLYGLENYGSSSYGVPQAAGSSYSSSSSQSSYNTLPQRSHGVTFESAPHSASSKNYGSNMGNLDNENFDSEIERLRKEMEMRTLALHHGSTDQRQAKLGGSHRTEVRTEMKYINGKPIYIKNEERKYKDGKLIHNETNEKGPEDLGTTGVVTNHNTFNSPTKVYSRQYEQQSNRQEQYPSTRYQENSYSSGPYYSSSDARFDATNSRYEPASHVSTSQTAHKSYRPAGAGYALSSQQLVNNLPGNVYSTEIREEHEQTHTSAGYKPVSSISQTVHSSSKPTDPAYSLNSQTITKPVPGQVYSTEIREEHETRTASGYNPSTFSSETDYKYNSYQPKASGIPTYRAPNTVRPSFQTSTLAPEISAATRKYDYSASRTQDYDSASRQYKPINTNYDTNIGSAQYDRYTPRSQSSGSSHYSSERNHANHRTYDQQPTASTATTTTTTTTTPRPASNSYRRPSAEHYTQDHNMVREASQTSYFNSRPSSTYYPRNYNRPEKTISNQREKATEETDYSQSVSRSHSQTTEKEVKSQAYQPASYSSSVTANEDKTRQISTNYYPSQYNRKFSTEQRAADEYGADDHSDDISSERKDTDSTLNIVVPGVIRGPQASRYPFGDEHERYDISPLIDGDESEIDSNEVPESGTNMPRPRPTYNNKYEPVPATNEHTSSHHYEQSKSVTSDQGGYNPRPVIIPRPHFDQHSSFVLTNSSALSDIRTTNVIPSRWVETRTKWKYFNGKLVRETHYNKYFENGILIHDNSTEKTRDQLAAEGVDVHQLDLSAAQLAEYGPVVKSSTHSQSHEVTHVQRFKNGQPIYELNHDKRFQDGQLVHENREEKDENDFARESGNLMNANRHLTHSQHLDQHFLPGGYDLPALSPDLLQTQDLTLNPSGYVRKHEVRQEEEFVNGQKVYNLFHEKEYNDGNLIRENKTELGPEDLRAQSIIHRDALKDLLEGRTHSHTGQETLHQQQKTTEDILTTQCLTCRNQLTSSGGTSSGSYVSGSHSSSVLGYLGIPAEHARSSAATFKHDVNVEEHYENGKMVKGREDTNKWKDGRLVDSKTEHYYDGSSRTNLDLSGSPIYGGGSMALLGTPEATIGSEYNSCLYNNCLNGADCRKSGNTQVCICKLGFKGPRCEEAYCPESFCRYGGSCLASSGTQVCSCPSGYTGYRCSTRIHSIRIGG